MNNKANTLDDLVDPSMEDIISAVAGQNGLSSKDLKDRTRDTFIGGVRDDAIAAIWTRMRDVTLTDIGIALGGRSYATIKKALQRCELLDVPVSGVIDRELVIEDAKKGMAAAEIAYKHHCSRYSVRNILYEAKIPFTMYPGPTDDQNLTLPEIDSADTKSSPKS
jgi:hypothetical protein